MNSKVLTLIGVLSLFLFSFVGAQVDVAYVVLSNSYIKPEITSVLDEMGLSYSIVCHVYNPPCDARLSSYNFSNSKMFIFDGGPDGDEFFPDLSNIPANQHPAILMNGRHMDTFGWTRENGIVVSSSSLVGINTTHQLSGNLSSQIVPYTSSSLNVYYLHELRKFDGIESVAVGSTDSRRVAVGFAKEGSVLTKSGYPNTQINADTIFFGITQAGSWSNDTKTLFKNSLLFLTSQGEYTLNLKQGVNLVSIPLKLSSTNRTQIFGAYPEITSVKKSVLGVLQETTTIETGVGYIITCSSPISIPLEGTLESGSVVLSSGMNLAGVRKFSNVSLSSLPLGVVEVGRRNSDGTYDLATRYSFGWYNPKSIVLESGKGYWFKTDSQTMWGGTA